MLVAIWVLAVLLSGVPRLNPDEIPNAKTVDIQGGSLTAYQLNAYTLQIGSGAQAELFATDLGGMPSAQAANPIAGTVVASNGKLVGNGALYLSGLPTGNGLAGRHAGCADAWPPACRV